MKVFCYKMGPMGGPFDSGGPWGHRDPVSAGVAPASRPRRARAAPASRWFAERRTPQDAPKTATRCLFLFIVFSMPSWINFWSIFSPNLCSKINQNRSKIDAKMHPILDSIFRSIFHFCSQLEPLEPNLALAG